MEQLHPQHPKLSVCLSVCTPPKARRRVGFHFHNRRRDHAPLDERDELHEPDVRRVRVEVEVRVGRDQPAIERRKKNGEATSAGRAR